MALSESIKQIAIFDECIYHLFFTVHRNQPQGKWLLFALLNKANIHPDMLKYSSDESIKIMAPPSKKKSCDTLFHIR